MTPVDKEMVITWYCEVCNQLFRILEAAAHRYSTKQIF